MNEISCRLLKMDDYLINKLEEIRLEAYNLNASVELSSFYAYNLRKGSYLVFGIFCDQELAGACYVSNAYNSLYIEQLFIMKKYQKSELHLGSRLLKYVLNENEVVEKYFDSEFEFSYLENINSDNMMYSKLGYKDTKSGFMRKYLK